MRTMTETCKEYASAIFALAKEDGLEKEYAAALGEINAQLERQPEYYALLESPNVPIRERRALIEQAFGDSVPEYVLSFTQLLCEKGRIALFSDCVSEYNGMLNALERTSVAVVTSAVELTDGEKAALIKKLEKLSGRTVTAEYKVDESILGGLIVRMDDTLIDGSIRRKLKDVKEVIE